MSSPSWAAVASAAIAALGAVVSAYVAGVVRVTRREVNGTTRALHAKIRELETIVGELRRTAERRP